MSKIIDPRSLTLTVGSETFTMPTQEQWGDSWVRTNAVALSPMTLTRSRQGSLGDPEESACTLTIMSPVTAVSSDGSGERPWHGSDLAPLVGNLVEVTGDDGRYVFAGNVASVLVSDDTVRLTDGTVLDALRIEVAAAGVLRILARTKIGYTPDDLPDATGNTVAFRLSQITDAVQEVSGLEVLWDNLAPTLPTSWVADRDVDAQTAVDVIRSTVVLADRVVVERGLLYSVVRRDAITAAPYDYYTVEPFVRDSPHAVVVPASAVPNPSWALDAEGLSTQFAFGYVDETQIPGSVAPVDKNQAKGDPVPVFDNDGVRIGWSRADWLETTERTRRVDHPTAGQDYGVSTWQLSGDGLQTVRQFGATTPPGGPGNAELRGVLVARSGTPRWRPDGGVTLLLDGVDAGALDTLLYGYEPPFGYPLVTITGAPEGRDQWRVVGYSLDIGHTDDEAVALTLEHPRLGLPTGVRVDELDPLVTIADTEEPGWTFWDCTQARTIQSGTVLEPPGTPTNLWPIRVSDNTTRLTWDTSGGPATVTVVEERVNNATEWARAALLTSSPGSAEVSTASDRSTVYRVTLSNPAGTSGTSEQSPAIRTRPNLISGVGFTWAGTSIVGTWLLDTQIPVDQYKIQVYRGTLTYVGGTAVYTWDAGPNHTDGQQFALLPGGSTGYTWANAPRPSSGTYCWAVMSRVDTVDGTGGYLRSSYYIAGTSDEY